MILPLCEEWQIDSDSHCWRLSKFEQWTNEKTGEEESRWVAKKFFPSISLALKYYCDMYRREVDTYGWEEAVAFQQELNKWLEEVLEPVLVVKAAD